MICSPIYLLFPFHSLLDTGQVIVLSTSSVGLPFSVKPLWKLIDKLRIYLPGDPKPSQTDNDHHHHNYHIHQDEDALWSSILPYLSKLKQYLDR